MTAATPDQRASDEELIGRALAGDDRAIGALYDRHGDRVYSLLRRLAGDDGVAEDWAQDTWIRIVRGLATFRGQASFGTWAHRIAVNVALNGRRQVARRAGHERRLFALRPTPHAAESEDAALLRIRLEAAIDALPSGMRRVLVLHDVEGYTDDEVAALVRTSRSTVRSQLARARAKVRAQL